VSSVHGACYPAPCLLAWWASMCRVPALVMHRAHPEAAPLAVGRATEGARAHLDGPVLGDVIDARLVGGLDVGQLAGREPAFRCRNQPQDATSRVMGGGGAAEGPAVTGLWVLALTEGGVDQADVVNAAPSTAGGRAIRRGWDQVCTQAGSHGSSIHAAAPGDDVGVGGSGCRLACRRAAWSEMCNPGQPRRGPRRAPDRAHSPQTHECQQPPGRCTRTLRAAEAGPALHVGCAPQSRLGGGTIQRKDCKQVAVTHLSSRHRCWACCAGQPWSRLECHNWRAQHIHECISTITMSVGTACPQLSGLSFLKGDPLPIGAGATGGKRRVFVLEFWATWCAALRAPHASLAGLRSPCMHPSPSLREAPPPRDHHHGGPVPGPVLGAEGLPAVMQPCSPTGLKA
jgi:hypothetical protein